MVSVFPPVAVLPHPDCFARVDLCERGVIPLGRGGG